MLASSRRPVRLVSLSHADLVELLAHACDRDAMICNQAEARLSHGQAMPTWAAAVLLSADLLPQIMLQYPCSKTNLTHVLKFVATCACTCTSWRSLVDARRTELLSHLGCIADPAAFDRCITQLQSRPRHGPRIQKPNDRTSYKANLRDAITLILGDDNDSVEPAE